MNINNCARHNAKQVALKGNMLDQGAPNKNYDELRLQRACKPIITFLILLMT